jgi:hypothetical protein
LCVVEEAFGRFESAIGQAGLRQVGEEDGQPASPSASDAASASAAESRSDEIPSARRASAIASTASSARFAQRPVEERTQISLQASRNLQATAGICPVDASTNNSALTSAGSQVRQRLLAERKLLLPRHGCAFGVLAHSDRHQQILQQTGISLSYVGSALQADLQGHRLDRCS